MPRSAVDVKVGGQVYRVKASADREVLERYASEVHLRLKQITGSDNPSHPQAMLLAALALAHDLEEARERNSEGQRHAEKQLRALLERVNEALGQVDDNGEPLEPLPPVRFGD